MSDEVRKGLVRPGTVHYYPHPDTAPCTQHCTSHPASRTLHACDAPRHRVRLRRRHRRQRAPASARLPGRARAGGLGAERSRLLRPLSRVRRSGGVPRAGQGPRVDARSGPGGRADRAKGRRYEELAAAGEMLYPGSADFIRAAAARGADRHRLGRAHPRDRGDSRADRPAALLPGHRRRRSDGAEQARSRAVSDGVRAPEGAYWTSSWSPGVRWRSRTRSGGWSRREAPTCGWWRSRTPTRRRSSARRRSSSATGSPI